MSLDPDPLDPNPLDLELDPLALALDQVLDPEHHRQQYYPK